MITPIEEQEDEPIILIKLILNLIVVVVFRK